MRHWLVLSLVACAEGGGTDAATTDSGATTAIGDDDDDDDGGVDVIACGEPFQACGGDPAGAWTVSAVCEVPVDDMGCPALTYELTADRSSGTITLDAGGTYTRAYDIDVDFTVQVPSSCLFGMGCAQLEAMAGGLVTGCTEAGGGCACDGTTAYLDSANGTWAVEGDVLVFDGVERHDFCVSGTQAVSVDQGDGTRVHWQR